MPKRYKTKKANNGTKTGDPKKKKDDKSFTTLRENPAREKNRPTEEELKEMLDTNNPAVRRYLKNLPKVIKAREAMEKRNPASGKKMTGGGHAKKAAPMYMMGGKVFEGAMGLMTALAKKNPKDFKKVAEGIN